MAFAYSNKFLANFFSILSLFDLIIKTNLFPSFSAIYMVLYSIAILSYFPLKEDFTKQRLNPLYTAAPTETPELDLYK